MTYITIINLIVAPVVLTIIYVYALAKIIRNEKAATRRSIQSLIMTGFYAAAMLIILTVPQLDAKDILQLVLTLGLVTATISYAISAVKMAEETKKQRYAEALPLLVPVLTRRCVVGKLKPNEVDYGTLQTGVGFEVKWHNFGKGVAINSRFSFWSVPLDSKPDKMLYFPPREVKSLEIGGWEEIIISDTWEHQLCDISEERKPRLVAEYQDIYERSITTVQEFRIEEENGNKRAFLGELYFTVNGKRLGEEVTHHDYRSYLNTGGRQAANL